jgi:hypothetical protein
MLRYKGLVITTKEHRFNGLHGSTRVKIEHTLGWLKLKWQALQTLPVKTSKRKHVARASRQIIICINFLLHPDGGDADDTEYNWNQRALHPPPPREEEGVYVPLMEVVADTDNWDEFGEREKEGKEGGKS